MCLVAGAEWWRWGNSFFLNSLLYMLDIFHNKSFFLIYRIDQNLHPYRYICSNCFSKVWLRY